jgi:replicative DNA helicase
VSEDHLKLPEDIEAERSLLATLCAPGNDLAAQECRITLQKEDFSSPMHRSVFVALQAVLDAQDEVSPLVLKDVLAKQGTLEKVGGYPGLVDLLGAEEVGRPMVLVKILREKRIRRQLMRLGHAITTKSADESAPSNAIIDEASTFLTKVVTTGDNSKIERFHHVSDDAIADLCERMEGKREYGLWIPSFDRTSAILGGMKPGQLIVLAARPGIGKSAMALNWVVRSTGRGKSAAVFSLEMSKGEVTNRMLSIHSQVNLREMVQKKDRHGLSKVIESKNELDQRPIWIYDKASITMRHVNSMVDHAMAVSRGKLDLIVLDYLQLLTSSDDARAARQSEAVRVGELTRACKLLAKDKGVPIVLLSQLNREVEHRNNGRPQLSDLRDSGAIEQDADVVMFIARKTKIEDISAEPDKLAELLIAKNRDGPTGVIPLFWDGGTTTFKEIEKQTDESKVEYKPTQTEIEYPDNMV